MKKTPEEIEKLAIQRFPSQTPNGFDLNLSVYNQIGFIAGYTQCQQENAERKYTKQELEKYFMIRHTQSVANAEKFLTTLNKQ